MLFVAETELFVGEKASAGGSVAAATLTSDGVFAVTKSRFMAERVCRDGLYIHEIAQKTEVKLSYE